MTLDLTPFHPELAALGAGLGLAGAVLAWRVDARVQAAAAVVVAAVLALQGQAPVELAGAIGLAAAASLAGHRSVRWLGAGAGAGVLIALQQPSTAAVLLLATAVGAVLLLDRPAHPDLAPIPTAGLLSAALVGTFCGAPDTEAAVLGALALTPALLGSLVARPRPAPGTHLAVVLLAAWICVDGYRGRPAGLTAAAVALTVTAVIATAATAARNPRTARWRMLAVAVVASVVSARTIGLDQRSSATAIVAALAGCTAVAVVAILSERAGSPRTPSG